MKSISDLLVKKIHDHKKQKVDKEPIAEEIEKYDGVEIYSNNNGNLTLECSNSSVASNLRFETHRIKTEFNLNNIKIRIKQ